MPDSRVRLPLAQLRQRRTTGALVGVIIALSAVLVALVIVALYLVQPRELPRTPQAVSPHYLFSMYGNADDPLNRPSSISIGPDGRMYVADTGNARVAVFTAAGGFIESFYGAGPAEETFITPTSVATASDGRVYVVDVGLGAVIVLSSSGEYQDRITFLQEPPVGIEIGTSKSGEETLYVTTRSGFAIGSLDGEFRATYLQFGAAPGTFDTPTSLVIIPTAEGQDPNLYIVDSLNYRVQALGSIETSATVLWTYGAPLPPNAALRYAGEDRKFGLPVDIAANDRGELFVVDGLSSQVVVLDAATGTFRENLGEIGSADGALFMPGGIDYHEGMIFVADKYNSRIEVFADPADPEFVYIEPTRLAPEDLLWILVVLGVAEVLLFGYLFAMRAPVLVFDVSALEAIAADESGEAERLIADALGAIAVPDQTDIIARGLLPNLELDVLTPSGKATTKISAIGADSEPEFDAFATAAIAVVASKSRRRVLVTADDLVADGARSEKLQVIGLEGLLGSLGNNPKR